MISNSNKSPLNLLLLINQPEVEAAVWRQKGKGGEREDWVRSAKVRERGWW